MRSRWALLGSRHQACCHVDRQLVTALRAGDHVNVATDCLGSIGISVVRDGRLVFAVGAVTAVPLGEVQVRRAPEQWDQLVESSFDFGGRDEHEVRLRHDVPLAATVGGQHPSWWLPHEIPDGALHVFTWRLPQVRCAVTELPLDDCEWFSRLGTASECVALARKGACPLVPAQASAMLLAADALQVGRTTPRPISSERRGELLAFIHSFGLAAAERIRYAVPPDLADPHDARAKCIWEPDPDEPLRDAVIEVLFGKSTAVLAEASDELIDDLFLAHVELRARFDGSPNDHLAAEVLKRGRCAACVRAFSLPLGMDQGLPLENLARTVLDREGWDALEAATEAERGRETHPDRSARLAKWHDHLRALR